MENIPKLIRSSENPNKLGMTVSGATVIALVWTAHYFGMDLSSNDALILVEAVFIIGGGIATVWGIVRKVFNGKWS